MISGKELETVSDSCSLSSVKLFNTLLQCFLGKNSKQKNECACFDKANQGSVNTFYLLFFATCIKTVYVQLHGQITINAI